MSRMGWHYTPCDDGGSSGAPWNALIVAVGAIGFGSWLLQELASFTWVLVVALAVVYGTAVLGSVLLVRYVLATRPKRATVRAPARAALPAASQRAIEAPVISPPVSAVWMPSHQQPGQRTAGSR